MIEGKKGAEMIIVWVLLIGFTIAMTSTVFIWEKNRAKELTKSAVISGEAKLECEEIAINARCNGDLYNIDITNVGRISISGLVFRNLQGDKTEFGIHQSDDGFPMGPKSSVSETLDLGNEKIEVIPLVGTKDKLYLCDKKVIKLCSPSGEPLSCSCEE